MKSAIERIIFNLTALQSEISELLLKNSTIIQTSFDSDFIFHIGPDHGYQSLAKPFISVQDRIFKRHRMLAEIISNILADSALQYRQAAEKLQAEIEGIILHRNTYSKSVQQENSKLIEHFSALKKILDDLYPSTDSEPILIPDTNALYANPDIEAWQFEEMHSVTLAITPSVLSDLDRHKVEHKVEDLRKKALKLINKLKEYRRRGALAEGVVVVKDRVRLVTIATEPDFSKTLSWLKQENDDDRLIAETLEIIRKYAGRPVAIITGDINLQNKCEHADLLFYEPPESFS